jgi:hypothetical protein
VWEPVALEACWPRGVPPLPQASGQTGFPTSRSVGSPARRCPQVFTIGISYSRDGGASVRGKYQRSFPEFEAFHAKVCAGCRTWCAAGGG